uniref:Uncharacterized protein n=1 Tax=Oryza sativa subsp. japonica TaxID=39947 RepID=Q6ZLA4_ORYSJ|nr:hypothetical protein [Oryza sativa Japonica Group]
MAQPNDQHNCDPTSPTPSGIRQWAGQQAGGGGESSAAGDGRRGDGGSQHDIPRPDAPKQSTPPPTTSPAPSRLQCNIHIGAKSIKKTSNAINGGVFVLLLFGVTFVSLGGGGGVLIVEVGGDGAAAREDEDEPSLPDPSLEQRWDVLLAYAQIALAVDRATDVGIKTACGSFQSAAGAFAWMRESGVDATAVAAGATTIDVLSLLSPASPPNHLVVLPALRNLAPGLALPRRRRGAPAPASAAAPASTAAVAAASPPPPPAPPRRLPAAPISALTGRAPLFPRRSPVGPSSSPTERRLLPDRCSPSPSPWKGMREEEKREEGKKRLTCGTHMGPTLSQLPRRTKPESKPPRT